MLHNCKPQTELTAIQRKRIVRTKEAARLRGVSEDTIRRQLKDRMVRLGPKSVGFRLEDVLGLPPPTAA